jgi:Zn-dependent protease
VFLSEPSETPFDLRFSLFGTHVRVSPWFWLISAALGWGLAMGDDTRTGIMYLAIWVACVFVSVLLHEFGHVWTGRIFGSHGHIVLHSFGGLAIGSSELSRGWQRFLVFFAGPLIQFVLFGAVVLAAVLLQMPSNLGAPEWQSFGGQTLIFLMVINLFWPLINLLPVWPLDGGQMSREIFTAVTPQNGLYISLGVSAAVAGLAALYFVFPEMFNRFLPVPLPIGRSLYTAIFFAFLCFQSVMVLTTISAARRPRHSEDEFPWER